MIHTDTSELKDLERDLAEARRRFIPEAKKATSKGALNIKGDWRDRWSGHPKIRHLPRTINYDVDSGPEWTSAEIGPDKAKMQGPLGNIIEFGTVNNAPIPGGMPALEAEDPRFVKAIADLAERLLGGTRVG